jgi:hypothetical protein
MSLCDSCYNPACDSHLKHMNCVVTCWDFIDNEGTAVRTMVYHTTTGEKA